MSEAATKPLRLLCDPRRTITYGIVQPGKLHDGGTPIVRVNNFHGHRLDLTERSYVSPQIEASYARSRPRPGDVLISLVGSIGQVAIASPEILGWNLARAVGLLPMPDAHHSKWVYYALQTPDAQSFIQRHANTTVQATFNLRDLAEIPIPYPEEGRRKSALAALSSLDDKIELNRRMNETLEALAQAIFKDWFVTFGPTRRKLECGTDPVAILGGLIPDPAKAAPLAALFPDSFGEDGLPEGWVETSIYDFASVTYGAPFASSRFNSEGKGRPLIRIRDLSNHGSNIFTDEVHKKEFVIQPGTIVVGMDGEFRARVWQGLPSLMNQRVCAFLPTERKDRAFSYCSIIPQLRAHEQSAIGTTVIHLGKKEIDTFTAIRPGRALLDAFSDIAEPMLELCVSNGLENRTLAETRDYLLPKLMSGVVRLREEKAVP